MTDQQSGDHARFLRAPGLRLDGVEAELVALNPDDPLVVERADRAFFLHVCEGSLSLERPGKPPAFLRVGDSLGIEKG